MQGCPALSRCQLKRALAQLKGRHALRDRALVILGVRSGLRISELLSLQVSQVFDGRATLPRFYLARRAAKGKRCGSSIVLHPDAAAALVQWIDAGGLGEGDFVFPSQKRKDQSLDRRSAWRILSRAFRSAGVVGMQGTHCLRKTFAKNVYKALKGDLFRTSKALRHRSVLTTLRYLSFEQSEIDQAILAT